MKKNKKFDEACELCEHSQEIFDGEYCICRKKGVVSPDDCCSSFYFDPLKIKVSVRKIPEFHPLPEWINKETKNLP